MKILGAHQSIEGGFYRAVERAHQAGCDCVQLFTKNTNQWAARDITADDVRRFRESLDKTGITHPIVHDSYLINLASPDPALWQRSVEAFAAELRRADALGIPYVVTHPGAYTTGSEQGGLQNVIRALDEVHRQSVDVQAQCLLETTAGQGTTLGWRFEQIGHILAGVKQPDRLGVCFDTCHVFAAGYAFGTPKAYKATMAEFDRCIGLDRIKAFHLNDSRRELGSRIDRHEHIGQGHLGIEPFRLLLADRRFDTVPMYLETPKGQDNGVDYDVTNLRLLRGL